MTSEYLVLSCEHGGNRVPADYRELFVGSRARAALRSHRGYDAGSRAVALALARRTGAPLHAATTTRLLVELNRSPSHHHLFSEFVAPLSPEQRLRLVERHYYPYREAVEHAIAKRLKVERQVLHVSVHSFVATWQGRRRRTDVGLLYDPARPGERRLCVQWQANLHQLAPELRVRRNDPYRGVSDGLVTFLRRRFAPGQYAGIELEVSQALVAEPGNTRRRTIAALVTSLVETLRDH